ncbi:MAG: hypothetical protein CSA11_01200 [Chloroflexi bacterium]|nr:MAG: hypothetical protein CSA11_01200 [Chloroflexota bacterium]
MKHNTFHGMVKNAMHAYRQSAEKTQNPDLWHSDALLTAVENAENAMKSMTVLKKHLPAHFHPLIRFAQPKSIWYLNVEKGITATQLNMLLDDLLLRIAADIGFAPRVRVMVQPSARRWSQSGFPLSFPKSNRIALPDQAEAEAIIEAFLHRADRE